MKKCAKFGVPLLFALILLIGLAVYDDYGISSDEVSHRVHAIVSYRWVNQTLFGRNCFKPYAMYGELPEFGDRYYGVAIQFPPQLLEDIYQHFTKTEMPFGTVFRMLHLYTFLIYYGGLICFYLLLRNLSGRRIAGVIGVAAIFTFGRFFAQSFYNLKDIAFAALMMAALCLTERVLRDGYKVRWCLLLALCSAFLVSVRIVGAIVPFFVLICALIDRKNPHKVRTALLILCAYPLWLLITPASWTDPLGFSYAYALKFSDYTDWNGSIAFAGEMLTKDLVPGDYFLRWIGISVPLVWLILGAAGVVLFLIRRGDGFRVRLLALLLIVFTLGYQALFRPTVYNGWRHAFYLYPLIILFAADAALAPRGKTARSLMCAAVTLCIVYNGVLTAVNHPKQYEALNPIGLRVGADYERDYWYLSFYDALLRLTENDPAAEITLDLEDKAAAWVLESNMQMLPQDAGSRLAYRPDEGEYLLLSYTKHPGASGIALDGYEAVHTESAYGIELTTVYRKVEE